ncbi:putative cytochrome p450 protein [Phaeoacremonium minimum UCRPA7]|uniref:Cytochrome P450 monooxygenase ABA1 n=1 Tax=Phaeoacremonium minimum (strain UCR-PA7) TaxID=1286976 RepID=R8BMB3_PHAM7|nr:putative cytochrome p450 protein [Phaeoacremonium minimum UCRPA7]EOO00516.1 putative cytochrome p450 protein [Phaeoacremonium minimum UCRPA7]
MVTLIETKDRLLAVSPSLLALGTVILLFLLASIISTVRQFFRLRQYKGPSVAGFSKWWMIKHVGGGRTHLDVYEVCQKYGPVARIGPNDLITDDPDLMKHMLNVRTGYRRSDWYHGMRLNPHMDNVLSMRDDDKHNELRAKMAAGYSGREVEGLEKKIDQTILNLINLFDSKYVSVNKPFDLGRKAQFFTLDVISTVAYGQPFGFLETDTDVYEYIKTTEENVPTIIVTTVLPWLMELLKSPLLKSLLPSEKDRLGLGKIMAIAKEKAAERFGPDKKVQKDMLGSFVAHGLTEQEAQSEILVQVLAGSDTTATAIRATMLYIMTSPRVVNALRAEIASTKRSTPIISDAEARGMPYLQAVIKEGLRIFPPVTGLMTKDVPKGGDTFKGMYFPEGTKIGYCAWGIFRRPEIWGEDVDEFRPERWLEASPEKLKQMESTLELIFSYGRWQCLGRNVALIELNKIFVELWRRFDFALVDPTKPWKSICCGIFLQSEYWVRAYKRED